MVTMAAILDSSRNDFSYLWSTSHPNIFYQISNQLAFFVQKKKQKINFLDGRHGGHLGFPMLALINLQVTSMLPIKFQVNWPFASGEEVKKKSFKMAMNFRSK